MANTYFFTGFPGFIASSLIKETIRKQYAADRVYVLVLPDLARKAQDEIAKLAVDLRVDPKLFAIVIGDITKPRLDISEDIAAELQRSVTHVFHLAAVYDLAVPEPLAYNVNVTGTRNVNEWVAALHKLRRYVYFSTAYVAGTREGRILESELVSGQTFKNHYESTKYEAEVCVRQNIDAVPTTIIRPGIVVGHSRTGETIKFDGPYFILNFLDKLRFLPVIPYLGSGAAEGNFVPVDYIIDATIYLSHNDVGAGKTYQLTDPRPYTAKEVYRMLMKAFLGREPKGVIPLALAKWFLSVPAVRRWLRVEKEALAYFTCMAKYDSTQAQQDLEGSGIACPDFKQIIDAIVPFYAKHKDDPNKRIVIR